MLADLPHPVRVAAGQRTERARAREREREKETIIYARSLARSLVISLSLSLSLSLCLAVCLSLPPSLSPSLPRPSLSAADTWTNLLALANLSMCSYVRERRFTCPWVCDEKHETD